jgi:catechol 2,3-dioxygenase-like lactoylglutathione lyase family enzyme
VPDRGETAGRERLLGLHHVTAIAGEPRRNAGFYAGLLGLRLVKQTVDFDDPATLHLYYGDATGRPGRLLTFFCWPGAARGRQGTGQATAVALAIPRASLGFWTERLIGHGVPFAGPDRRFGERLIAFRDPDGLALELVAVDAPPGSGWAGGPVPAEHAVRGVHGVTLWQEDAARTEGFLTEEFGFRRHGTEGTRTRLALAGGGAGLVDVVGAAGFWTGEVAVGTFHHVAWGVADETGLAGWRERLVAAGLAVTPVRDRRYFRSIYLREPGGVLFEVATDGPGFAVDEPADDLGGRLSLPPWLEADRARIERALPPLAPRPG